MKQRGKVTGGFHKDLTMRIVDESSILVALSALPNLRKADT